MEQKNSPPDTSPEAIFQLSKDGDIRKMREAIEFLGRKGDRQSKITVSKAICVRDGEGRTPLHYVCEGGFVRMAVLLINNGAPVAAK